MVRSEEIVVSKQVVQDIGYLWIGRVVARRNRGLFQSAGITAYSDDRQMVTITVAWWRPNGA